MTRKHFFLLRQLLLWACLFAPASASAEIQYVIALSVDGLRGDYLRTFIETVPEEFPNFARLRNSSAYTYEARCDYSHSITIPNHLSMLTGRPVAQPAGMPDTVHHGFTSDSPLIGQTVHANGNPAVSYKASIFDAAHDRGLSTALYMGKSRLAICSDSYNAFNGAPDAIGADNGRGKIDFVKIAEADTPLLLSIFSSHIAGKLERFSFFHFAEADYAGHADGWQTAPGSSYRIAVAIVDAQLGVILHAIEANPQLAGKTALLLTADHGGGGGAIPGIPDSSAHADPSLPADYTIPFFVSAPGVPGGSDLYILFENRARPAPSIRPVYASPNQPIRNGDMANISATLLGLPPVPGSLLLPKFKKGLPQPGKTMR